MVKVDASPWMPAAGHARRGSVPRSPPRRAAGRARTGPPHPRLPLYVTFSTEACLRAEAPERPSRAQTSVSGGLRPRPASGGPSAFHPCRGGRQPQGHPVPTSRPGAQEVLATGTPQQAGSRPCRRPERPVWSRCSAGQGRSVLPGPGRAVRPPPPVPAARLRDPTGQQGGSGLRGPQLPAPDSAPLPGQAPVPPRPLRTGALRTGRPHSPNVPPSCPSRALSGGHWPGGGPFTTTAKFFPSPRGPAAPPGAQDGGATAHGRRVSGTLVEAAASVVVQGQLFHGAQGGGRRGPPGLQHKHGLAHPVLRAQPARDGHLRRWPDIHQ